MGNLFSRNKTSTLRKLRASRVFIGLAAVLIIGVQIASVVTVMFPSNASAALDWSTEETGKNAELVHGFIERCSGGRLGTTGALADKISAERASKGEVFHIDDGGSLESSTFYGEVNVAISDIYGDGNNKRQCQNLSKTVATILYGSISAFVEKFYNKDGTDWVRDPAWTDDNKIVSELRSVAVSKGYYQVANGGQHPRDTSAYRYNVLRPIFEKCFVKSDAQTNPDYYFEDLDGNKYDFKAGQENAKYSVGLIIDRSKANGGYVGGNNDGTWSCREFRDNIKANQQYFREILYLDDVLKAKEEERVAEVKAAQTTELFNSVTTPFNNCYAVLGSAIGKRVYEDNPSTVRNLVASWLSTGESVMISTYIQDGKLEDFKNCLTDDDQYGQTLRDVLAIEANKTREVDETIGDASENEATCESEGGALGWILCKVLELGDAVMSGLDETVRNLLEVPESYTQRGEIEEAWKSIRNISYMVLVPITLVMVIGTALGFDFISAYTIKRALPRLVIATIFIALSYDIALFLVTMTNNIGAGIGNFIMGAFNGANEITLVKVFDPPAASGAGSNAAQTAGAGVGVVGLVLAGGFGLLAVGSLGILLSYVFIAIVGLAMGFFLLSLRQMLIIFLMLMAPVAILAWIFPGNDKLWKLWWGTFSKLLLLYPLIMILLAAGKSFAWVIGESNGNLAATLLKLVAYIGPYFMIPSMFKFAGGAFATLSGMANNRSKGLFDRQKKYRGRKGQENWRDTKAGNRFSERNALSRGFNRTGMGVGAGAKGRFGLGERGRQAIDLNSQASADEALKNNPKLQKLAFNDDGNAVMALGGSSRQNAEAAARDLFTDDNGNYDEVRANRAIEAAAAVGFSRSNAQAAMTTLAQNKARSVATGAQGREQIQRGINRLAGGNAQMASNMRDSFAFHASGAGRGDLGATNWNQAHASLAGFERTDLYQAAHGQPNAIVGAREDALMLARSGDVADRQRAATHLTELQSMSQSATGPARDAIQESIDLLSPILEPHMNNTDAGAAGPPAPQAQREIFDSDRGDPSHSRYDATYVSGWSAADLANGYRETVVPGTPTTNRETARRTSRVYQGIDPHNLT